MNFKDYILVETIGFKKYPKGWNKDTLKKYAKKLTKDTGLSPKDKGWFDVCVSKMEKHFGEGAKGFCADIKSAVWGTEKWRGKGKTKKEVYAQKRAERKKKGE